MTRGERMRHQRLTKAAALFVIMLGCSGPDVMEPVPARQEDAVLLRGLVSGLVGTVDNVLSGLLSAVPRLVPLSERTIVAETIGWNGGVIRGAGVELEIPRGALREATRITLVVPASGYLEAEFHPHGLKFRKPVRLRFDLGGGVDTNAGFVGTYYTLPLLRGLIQPAETFDAVVRNGAVEFWVNHFSRYGPAYRRGYTAAGG